MMRREMRTFYDKVHLCNRLLFSLLFLRLITTVSAHGLCSDPRQRGALRLDNHPLPIIDKEAPQDFEAHFPSGSKDKSPGSGHESVKRAAGYEWTPYKPFDPNFKWRAGVCGDELGGTQDHLIGGRYYHDAQRVREYQQGAIIFLESEIVTHHNGYFNFYICNLDTCGGDISPKCFQEGHCHELLRAYGPCESRFHQGCSPVDPAYPGRWYLPCAVSEPMIVGGAHRTMAYVLPPHLVCDHCVIQWYWTSANNCNPPGVREYFTSDRAPEWNDCPGQGGAKNGWTDKGPCGGSQFPEEYWQCADVRIVPNDWSEETDSPAPTPSPTATPSPFVIMTPSPSASPKVIESQIPKPGFVSFGFSQSSGSSGASSASGASSFSGSSGTSSSSKRSSPSESPPDFAQLPSPSPSMTPGISLVPDEAREGEHSAATSPSPSESVSSFDQPEEDAASPPDSEGSSTVFTETSDSSSTTTSLSSGATSASGSNVQMFSASNGNDAEEFNAENETPPHRPFRSHRGNELLFRRNRRRGNHE